MYSGSFQVDVFFALLCCFVPLVYVFPVLLLKGFINKIECTLALIFIAIGWLSTYLIIDNLRGDILVQRVLRDYAGTP